MMQSAMLPVEDKIAQLDLSNIIKKLCFPPEIGGYNWPEAETRQVAEQYRAFLLRNYQDKLNGIPVTTPPSTVVDIFWHMHILFTQQYHQDCEDIFGYYLHHDPRQDPRFNQ